MSLQTVPYSDARPTSVDHEKVLLGTLLNVENFAYRIAARLSPDLFTDVDHQQVCQAILEVLDRNQPVHLLTVLPAFVKVSNHDQATARTKLLGLAEQESMLTARYSEISQPALSDEVIDTLIERWQRRELLRLSLQLRECAVSEEIDVQDTIGRLAEDTDRIAGAASQAKGTADHLSAVLEQGRVCYESGDTLLGPAVFQIKKLDTLMDGAHPGGIVVVAGWTGSGKSSLFNSIVKNCTALGVKTYSWSGELSPDRQLHRQLAAETGINSRVIAKGGYYNAEKYPGGFAAIDAAANRIEQAGHVFESGSMTLTRLLTTISYQYRVHGVRVFLFDRKELFTVDSRYGNTDAAVGEVLARLRALMTELGDACAFVASQLRKSHMDNPGKRPVLADVIGAGEVIASSTAVVMVYRPEYYGITEDEQGVSLKGVAFLEVVKNSFGGVGDVRCAFEETTSEFMEESEYDEIQLKPVQYGALPSSVRGSTDDDTPF